MENARPWTNAHNRHLHRNSWFWAMDFATSLSLSLTRSFVPFALSHTTVLCLTQCENPTVWTHKHYNCKYGSSDFTVWLLDLCSWNWYDWKVVKQTDVLFQSYEKKETSALPCSNWQAQFEIWLERTSLKCVTFNEQAKKKKKEEITWISYMTKCQPFDFTYIVTLLLAKISCGN